MKKSLIILNKLNEKSKKMKALMDDGKTKEAHALIEEINNLQEEYEAQKKLEELEDEEMNRMNNHGQLQNIAGSQKVPGNDDALNYEDVFFKAFSGQRVTQEEMNLLQSKSALSTGTNEDGGYLIPDDQQTAIKKLKRSLPALENHVKIEPVKNAKGSRNIEKNALYTPFGDITEGSPIADTDSPQFVNIAYAIKDKGGILPVPNNLFNDGKAAIKAYLNNWLAKKSVATRNAMILGVLNTLTKTAITGLDDIKKAINVTLDPAISSGAKIFTNQSGFQYLDTLKDSDGNYILQPDPADKSKYLVSGKRVEVFSDKAMPNRDDGANFQAPLIIGDLEEAVVLFDRQQMSLLATKIGGDAFKYNRTDIRAIEREDVKKFDAEAVVFGEVEVGASV